MIKISVVSLLLSSSVAMAGGDIQIVEPIIETPQQVVTVDSPSNFYAGVGYSCLQMGLDNPDIDVRSMTAISLTAGYLINQYLAIEGRYTTSLGDLDIKTWDKEYSRSWDMSNIGLYLKPQYAFGQLALYGLLGYGIVNYDNGGAFTEGSVQYGGGLNTMVTDYVEVYVDYRRLYDDDDFDNATQDQDTAVNSFSLGVNYHF